MNHWPEESAPGIISVSPRGDLRPEHSYQVSCQEAGSPTWTRQPRSICLEVLQGGRGQENYLHAIANASDQAAYAAREVCE